MANILKAACVQMNGGPDRSENLKQAALLIREAAAQDAALVCTPEITDQVLGGAEAKMENALSEQDHPGLPHFSDLAKELGIFLNIGSMAIKLPDHKIVNRSFVFTPKGEIAARYDKIHLYDADLPNGETYKESNVFTGGQRAVIAPLQNASLGLSICYDLRFPHLFRDLVKQGANILSVPAAFTVPSGKAHWEVLLRARAIETGSFVIAAAQSGDHQGIRKTYGHSLIIGPWGDVLADAGTAVGIICAEFDLDEVQKVRQSIPALQHDRDYSI